jgi:4-hydroxybenzoate polyprenyltransferase
VARSAATRLGVASRVTGLVRLVHPLPSILDALVVAGLATAAGAEPPTAARAAGAMLLLQFSIGATNDLVDAPADRRVAPHKPLPAGRVTPRAARVVAVVAATAGLALAAAGGPASLAVAAAGLATGLIYDLRLKATAWSWLPYAIGIPLLVVFAWVGSGLALPTSIVVLAPLAGLAGCQLAIGNALSDLERDRQAGLSTVATSLGPDAARLLMGLCAIVLVAATWIILGTVGGSGAALGAAAAGTALTAAGVIAAGAGSILARRRAWECQAAGLGLLAVGLAMAMSAPALL